MDKKGKGIFALIPEIEQDVDLTDASRLNDNTLYKFLRAQIDALELRNKELEREIVRLKKGNQNNY